MPVNKYPQKSKLQFYTKKSQVYILFLALLKKERKIVVVQCIVAKRENRADTLADKSI